MLEADILTLRSQMLQKTRAFFISRGYIELDTPSMSPALPPDTTHEVFQASYIDPWTDEEKAVFLSASHEYFLKKTVAATGLPVFQLSKSWKNCESAGRLNSPEFTQLEVYTPGTSFVDSSALTKELLAFLSASSAPSEKGVTSSLSFPFIQLSIEEAFQQTAGFSPAECTNPSELAQKVRNLGIPEFPDNPFDEWPSDELFELILSQCVEPALSADKNVFLMKYPDYMPYLAKTSETDHKEKGLWKECWTLYSGGIQIAFSRSEETSVKKARSFLETEGKLKAATARVKHTIDDAFWKTYESFPECSSIELNFDRILMLTAGKNSIEAVTPFPFRLKTGYY